MTSTSKGYPQDPDDDSKDLLAKISMASALEQSGQTAEARALYQEVAQTDPSGMCGASARRALEALDIPPALHPSSDEKTDMADVSGVDVKRQGYVATSPKKAPRSLAPHRKGRLPKGFYNLSISRKHVVALILSELISLGLVGISAFVIIRGLQSQLALQAESELGVTQQAYNIKINYMEFGLRAQADNPAVIASAKMGQPPPALRNQVKAILENEIKGRNIEYATLVGRDLRIIVNANADRQGEVFDPNKLVSNVLRTSGSIKAAEIVEWAELQKEKPPLPQGFANQEDALIRYTVTPVKDPVTKSVLGALIAGDIVNNKLPIVETTINAFESGYSAVYLHKPTGEFSLATSLANVGNELRVGDRLPKLDLLTEAVKNQGKPVTRRVKMGANVYTMAARSLPNSAGEPTAILVRGTPETRLNQLLFESLWLQLAVAVVVILLHIILAIALSKVIAEPIKGILEAAQKFHDGDNSARAPVYADDEVGQLACSFNQMADNINTIEAIMAEQGSIRQAETDFQRRENERLQQGVIDLLLDIEKAKMGDLTVRAKVDDGEMGSIADAFNATLSSLRQLVTQMQTAADHVHESAFSSEASVRKLSQEATTQANVIAVTLNSVAEIGQSIQSVSDSAQEAAVIARKALLAAQDGWETMDETVRSIQNIRASVAETSKKVKRLAESSQEIYKIVSIISGISEKTNLLAFNASIEAARAGKNGQGFRVVADEVRRLAERVTNSTKEIEHLVSTIQQETDEVLQTMDQSTKQVVTGTKLVAKTKQTLENLALISQKIDQLLQSISVSTVSQAQASKMVNQTMEEVAAIAKNTSTESEAVSLALQTLVAVAEELQGSMSKFRVDT